MTIQYKIEKWFFGAGIYLFEGEFLVKGRNTQ
jgi:hypothetical protein